MNESHGLNDSAIMMDLMVLPSCGYDNQSYKKWGFSCQNDFDEHVGMLLEMAFSTYRDASLYISQCHIIIQHLIGGLLYFCGFRVPTVAINCHLCTSKSAFFT